MYPKKESATLELKEKMTDSFLKTVSAFSNYCDGVIIFGVADDGQVIGIPNPDGMRLQIENKINGSISPAPDFLLKDNKTEGKSLIELTVFRGRNTPYVYHNNAYRRSDTSTTPVDTQEFRRLAIEGSALSYDQILSTEENLSFKMLEKELRRVAGIKQFNQDTLRSLGLMNQNSYTRGAELLADLNKNAQSRTTVVRFGKTYSEFMDRGDFDYQSLLSQYQGALNMFDKWYQPYEAVVGFERVRRIQIPTEAYREAVANALLHRRYDLNGAVQISMFEDRIDILSPGGLPAGISETAYLYSQLSLPRNLKIAEVFHRLHIIERFGTGINRIRDEYTPFTSKPAFEVTDDYIRIVLPVIDYLKKPDERDLKEQILVQIGNATRMSRTELERVTGYQKSRLQEVLKQLVSENKIEMLGQGPTVTYQIKQR